MFPVGAGPRGERLDAEPFELQQAPISDVNRIAVPGNGSATLTGADRPRIRLVNLATNQDACKGIVLLLTYGGSAVK